MGHGCHARRHRGLAASDRTASWRLTLAQIAALWHRTDRPSFAQQRVGFRRAARSDRAGPGRRIRRDSHPFHRRHSRPPQRSGSVVSDTPGSVCPGSYAGGASSQPRDLCGDWPRRRDPAPDGGRPAGEGPRRCCRGGHKAWPDGVPAPAVSSRGFRGHSPGDPALVDARAKGPDPASHSRPDAMAHHTGGFREHPR